MPFRPNEVQAWYEDVLAEHYPEGLSSREIVLKARQEGFSTYFLVRIFCRACNNSGVNASIITHKSEATEEMFDRIRLMYEKLPADKKPRLRRSNIRQMKFRHDSQIQVLTNGEDDLGRSGTFTDVLASEFSRWRDPEAFTALLPAVPKEANLYIETTANGVDNQFHSLYLAAEAGDIHFRNNFVPWFWHPKYSIEAPASFVPGTEEQALIDSFGISMNQAAWYAQQKLVYKAAGDLRIFYQEYPSTPTEAFILSGESRFDTDIVRALSMEAQNRKPIVNLPSGWRFYSTPIKGHIYMVGADPAEGSLATGTDRDFHAAVIYDRDNNDPREGLVAVYESRSVEPFQFAETLVDQARHYNNAWIAVEHNNTGVSVLSHMVQTLRYPFVYQTPYYDPIKGRHNAIYGIRVTSANKVRLVDMLAQMLATGEIWPVDFKLVTQLSNYGIDKKGKLGARSGHDDLVSALYCLVEAMMRSPTKAIQPEDIPRGDDWGREGPAYA